MSATWKHRIVIIGIGVIGLASGLAGRSQGPQSAPCVDYSKDPAGCQPSTFDTPLADMPTVRVNRQGVIDPFSSEEDARAGGAVLEKNLHLFRNFEHRHWVLMKL